MHFVLKRTKLVNVLYVSDNLIYTLSISPSIQIIFMDDLSSRCFVGILTPVPPGPCENNNDFKSYHKCVSFSDDSQLDNQITSSEESTEDEFEGKSQACSGHGTGAGLTLPCGKMLRLYDCALCQMIFGSD